MEYRRSTKLEDSDNFDCRKQIDIQWSLSRRKKEEPLLGSRPTLKDFAKCLILRKILIPDISNQIFTIVLQGYLEAILNTLIKNKNPGMEQGRSWEKPCKEPSKDNLSTTRESLLACRFR